MHQIDIELTVDIDIASHDMLSSSFYSRSPPSDHWQPQNEIVLHKSDKLE